MRSVACLFVILAHFTVFSLPPPTGLNFKRAKQIGDQNEQSDVEPPPHLQLRSRMMAAMNSHANPTNENVFSQPLILTKNKNLGKKQFKTDVTPIINTSKSIETSTVKMSIEDVRNKFTDTGDEKVNLKVRPVLTTNFVDANGRIVKDVVSIPIRVSDGHIHAISKNAKNATASSQAIETEKDVNVAFRSSLPLWLI